MPWQVTSSTVSSVAGSLAKFLASQPLGDWAASIWQVYQARRFRGLYRVGSHQVSLRLCDRRGRKAIHEKVQKVVYLRDDVFAVQDQAWGDGDIFAEYTCSPGVVVDRYKEGFRWKTLISLRSTRHAGDKDVIRTRRVIKNGFTTPVGNFQTQIDHPHKSLSISVIFPSSRLPKCVHVVEQNARVSSILGNEHAHHLPDGNLSYSWSTHKVRLYEAYIIRWEW